MEIILILALIIGLISLFSIKRKRHLMRGCFDLKKVKHYNPRKDYLDDVKVATKKRFEEEASQQAYKNNIKKDYLG